MSDKCLRCGREIKEDDSLAADLRVQGKRYICDVCEKEFEEREKKAMLKMEADKKAKRIKLPNPRTYHEIMQRAREAKGR